MFVDRETEIDALDALLARPGAQFTVVYARRWVGKTTLWELISEGFRAFVGRTAFEEIGCTWTLEQAAAGRRYAFFARAGFTDAARKEAAQVGAPMVDLAQLDRELQRQQ